MATRRCRAPQVGRALGKGTGAAQVPRGSHDKYVLTTGPRAQPGASSTRPRAPGAFGGWIRNVQTGMMAVL